MNTEKFDQILV